MPENVDVTLKLGKIGRGQKNSEMHNRKTLDCLESDILQKTQIVKVVLVRNERCKKHDKENFYRLKKTHTIMNNVNRNI